MRGPSRDTASVTMSATAADEITSAEIPTAWGPLAEFLAEMRGDGVVLLISLEALGMTLMQRVAFLGQARGYCSSSIISNSVSKELKVLPGCERGRLLIRWPSLTFRVLNRSRWQ